MEALEGKRRENELAVRTVSLTKRFGGTEAVTDLCLQIPTGCLYGLVGPNGAGKSTTVGMLTGSILPTSGRIELFGRAYDPDSPWFKMRMGVVSEVPALFSRLSGGEQLQWTGVMFGLERAEAHRRAEQLLALVGLEKQGNDPVADYSRGMKKKLALACALIHAPGLVVLDEPFEGVDAVSVEIVRQLLTRLTERGTTVLVTTHILEAIQDICHRVGILAGGRLVRQFEGAELKSGGRTLRDLFVGTVTEGRRLPELPSWLVGKND